MFGLGGVGKTSLIHRFLFNKFDSAYTATIEDDYRQVITYNNHIVDVTVLDTAGNYQFPAMRKHAIQHGHGFVLVYAIDDTSSLEEVKRLYDEISANKKDSGKCPLILVGNKTDKSPVGKRKVTNESVQEVLDDWSDNVEHIETSAKFNHNVSLIFNKLIGIIDEKNIETLGCPNIASISRPSVKLPTNKTQFNRTFSLEVNLDNSAESRGMKKKKSSIKRLFARRTIR